MIKLYFEFRLSFCFIFKVIRFLDLFWILSVLSGFDDLVEDIEIFEDYYIV